MKAFRSRNGRLDRLGRYVAALAVVALGAVLAACPSGPATQPDPGTDPGTPVPVTLSSISVSPAGVSVAKGLQRQMQATGHYSDGSTKDLSAQVVWASTATGIATIGSGGLADAVTPGTTTITAAKDGVTGQTTLTVTTAVLTEIDLSSGVNAIPAGEDLQATAVGIFSDHSTADITQQVIWTTGDSAVATVGSGPTTHGLVHGVATGTTTVTATLAGVTGQLPLRISSATLTAITVNPLTPALAAGTAASLTATASYSDGSFRDVTAEAVWDSSNTPVATVISGAAGAGEVTGVAAGTAVVTAVLGSVTGAAQVTVTTAHLTGITVTPASPSVAAGFSVDLHATGDYTDGSQQDLTGQVTWQSTNTAVAQVGSGSDAGVVAAVAPGAATVSAAYQSITGQATVTVTSATLQSLQITPADPSVNENATLQLTATGTYSDSSQQDLTGQVTWQSSNGAVAAVSNVAGSRGVVSGIAQGQAAVTASLGGVQGVATLTVNADPNAPVSMAAVAQPNVILDDGSDASQITVTVQPADPSGGQIADGTQIDFVVSQGGATLSAGTATTSGGTAHIFATSTVVGSFTVTATVHGTGISGQVQGYAAAGFADVLSTSGYTFVTVNSGVVTQGSQLGLTVANFSNRSFSLDQYELTNGGSVVTTDSSATDLNNNLLPGGAGVQIIYTFQTDTQDNGFVASFSLTDPATGTPFSVAKSYTLP